MYLQTYKLNNLNKLKNKLKNKLTNLVRKI